MVQQQDVVVSLDATDALATFAHGALHLKMLLPIPALGNQQKELLFKIG